MGKIEAVSSFVKGFDRKNASDIINAMYVTKSICKVDFQFDFQSRGSRGVDSSEIRKILFFADIKRSRNNKKITKLAKQLSAFDSDRLGWLAQYIMNGKTHLYSREVAEASVIEKNILCKVSSYAKPRKG